MVSVLSNPETDHLHRCDVAPPAGGGREVSAYVGYAGAAPGPATVTRTDSLDRARAAGGCWSPSGVRPRRGTGLMALSLCGGGNSCGVPFRCLTMRELSLPRCHHNGMSGVGGSRSVVRGQS